MDRNKKGIPQGREYLGERSFSNKEAGAGFPKKKEGNSLFLGIPGERGFRIKGTKKGNAQPRLEVNLAGVTVWVHPYALETAYQWLTHFVYV
jgi:hypothetical protein